MQYMNIVAKIVFILLYILNNIFNAFEIRYNFQNIMQLF